MFKKTKITKSQLALAKKGETKAKKGSFFGVFIGGLSVVIITLIGISIIGQMSGIKFDLSNVPELGNFKLNLTPTKKETTDIKSTDGKTNILIVGRGGDENDAPNLTDTIMIASLDIKEKTISMFSIPRDLYVNYPTGGYGKINATYPYALKQNKNDEKAGMEVFEGLLEKITGEKIHYYVNMDFEGFRQIIDTVGGIEVNVPQAIVDTTYPGKNHTYTTFRINKGLQKLDGATALKYARSRHSTSDFDRALRQQLIIDGLKQKALSLGIITSPTKIASIYGIIKSHVTTDLSMSQIISLAFWAKDVTKENTYSSNLNNTCYGVGACEKGAFLYTPNKDDFGGASVLIQNGATKSTLNNYLEINKFAKIVFDYPEVFSEKLKINIFNSTKVGGLATQIGSILKTYGFTIPDGVYSGNTGEDKYEKSIIYYYSPDGTKPKTVSALEEFIFGGSQNITTIHKYSTDPEVKIELIIGNDYKALNF